MSMRILIVGGDGWQAIATRDRHHTARLMLKRRQNH